MHGTTRHTTNECTVYAVYPVHNVVHPMELVPIHIPSLLTMPKPVATRKVSAKTTKWSWQGCRSRAKYPTCSVLGYTVYRVCGGVIVLLLFSGLLYQMLTTQFDCRRHLVKKLKYIFLFFLLVPPSSSPYSLFPFAVSPFPSWRLFYYVCFLLYYAFVGFGFGFQLRFTLQRHKYINY